MVKRIRRKYLKFVGPQKNLRIDALLKYFAT